MISDMVNLSVTITRKLYPFFVPVIAAIGAFVTGSDTNIEVMLGRLQTNATNAISASRFWLAVAAVDLIGQDSKLLS